jgi:hypothetical protein
VADAVDLQVFHGINGTDADWFGLERDGANSYTDGKTK